MKSQIYSELEEGLYDGLKGSPNLGDSFSFGDLPDFSFTDLKYKTLTEIFKDYSDYFNYATFSKEYPLTAKECFKTDFQEEDTAVYIGISVGNFISGVTKCTVTEVEEGDIFVQHLLTGEMRWFPADEFILYEDK